MVLRQRSVPDGPRAKPGKGRAGEDGAAKRDLASSARAYLIAYNVLEAAGWLLALLLTLWQLAVKQSPSSVYEAVSPVVNTVQFVSLLEVVHAFTGLVRTNPANAIVQWLGRSHVLLVTLVVVPPIRESVWVSVMFLAWSVSEIIRYPQYALAVAGRCPSWLEWLRYSAFIPLYPLGVLGELGLLYLAIPIVAQQRILFFDIDFEGWILPFRYNVVIQEIMVAYVPLWGLLYYHMFKQRAAKLSNRAPADAAAADTKSR